MKRSLLLAFALAAGIASAQNLPLWWSGGSGSGGSGENATTSVFDGNGNLYTLANVAFTTKVTKFSNTGAVIWATTVPVFAYGIMLDGAGDPIVTGASFGADFIPNLAVGRLSGSTGTADVRVIDNPFESTGGFNGFDAAVDPVDGNLVVATALVKGGGYRPYLFKFDKNTLAEVWRSGLDNVEGYFTHLVPSGNRIYIGGFTNTGSVIVGYASTTGDLTTIQPTSGSSQNKHLQNMTVVNDRVIWAASTGRQVGGEFFLGEHYGQADFTPGSGNAFTEVTIPDSGNIVNDVAYDASTGQLAFQVSSLTGYSVRFATIDEATDGFFFGQTVSGLGRGIGLAPVTGGRFAAYYQSPPLAPGQVGVTLVDPVLGTLAGSILGPGTVGVDPIGRLQGGYRPPIGSLERATAINVATPTGARVYSTSYVAGPAADSKRLKEDTSFTFNVLHNDPGVGAKMAVVNSGPSHGTLSLAANGGATYTPAANWYGVDSFAYDLYIDGIFVATHTATCTVLNVNDAPVAVADNLGTVGTALTILPLLDNDANVDGEASPLRYLSVTQPSNGTVTLANNKTALKIKAAPGQAGQPFSFTYTVQNGTGMTSTATVTGTF